MDPTTAYGACHEAQSSNAPLNERTAGKMAFLPARDGSPDRDSPDPSGAHGICAIASFSGPLAILVPAATNVPAVGRSCGRETQAW